MRTQRQRIALVLLVVMTAAMLQACAARQPALRDSALVLNELSVAASRVEQQVFNDKLITKERHDAIGKSILRLLQAANSYSKAIQAGGDGAVSRADVVASLDDAITVAHGLDAVVLVLEQIKHFLE